jgi:hypothetical protein
MIGRVIIASCIACLPLQAQQDSLMKEAVRIATEGRADSALQIVQGALQRTPPRDPLYPEILYTGGVVSVDVDAATSYFRRVSIEYSSSPWAGQSLLRLAQLAYAASDTAGTTRSAERILNDYPSSDIRGEAAFLLARTHLDARRQEEGCRYLRMAEQASGEDVELQNRISFYIQRCETVAAPDEQPPDTPAPVVSYSVQVAAVESAAAADELMRGLQREGYDAQVVREDGLLKVRVGRYQRRADAQEMAAELRGRVGGRPFVVENR